MIQTSAFKLASTFIGLKEVPGAMSNPLILGMLQLDNPWVENDETAWCSAFINFISKLAGHPRSKSLAARSNLLIGTAIDLKDAKPEEDIVILSRGDNAPPASVLSAPGHVGFYAGQDDTNVLLLGGNQGDSVNISKFPKSRVLGVRRLG